MITVVVVFRSGKEVRVRCEGVTVDYDNKGRIDRLTWYGEETPLFVAVRDISCIYCERGDTNADD